MNPTRPTGAGTARPSSRPSSAVPKHAPHAKRAPFAVLVLALIGGGMCALLALNTAAAANEVSRHDLADQDQSVAAQLVQLQNQVQDSAAPGNLSSAAAALGMVPAGNPAFLEIGADGTVRVLGSPAAASAVPVYIPPKASKSASKSASATKSASASSSTSKAASKSASTSKSTSKSASKAASKAASPSPTRSAPRPSATPTPSPTPTPNSTLPGGNR